MPHNRSRIIQRMIAATPKGRGEELSVTDKSPGFLLHQQPVSNSTADLNPSTPVTHTRRQPYLAYHKRRAWVNSVREVKVSKPAERRGGPATRKRSFGWLLVVRRAIVPHPVWARWRVTAIWRRCFGWPEIIKQRVGEFLMSEQGCRA